MSISPITPTSSHDLTSEILSKKPRLDTLLEEASAMHREIRSTNNTCSKILESYFEKAKTAKVTATTIRSIEILVSKYADDFRVAKEYSCIFNKLIDRADHTTVTPIVSSLIEYDLCEIDANDLLAKIIGDGLINPKISALFNTILQLSVPDDGGICYNLPASDEEITDIDLLD